MRNYTTNQINTAAATAKSYKEFKSNLVATGARVPEDVAKFPHNMSGFRRKLRYEKSQDPSFGEHMSAHDLRASDYYTRLERLGHPDPLLIMQQQFKNK